MNVTGSDLWEAAPTDVSPNALWDQLSAHARDVLDGDDFDTQVTHVAAMAHGFAVLWPHMHAQAQATALLFLAALREQLYG